MGHQADIIYDNKTQLVEKGRSSFFFKNGGTITEGGGGLRFVFVFDGG